MTHDLYFDEDGQASMMYVGEPPWHGLGTPLQEPDTSAEAIRAAKLDWEVVKKPVAALDDKGVVPVPHLFATVRADQWGKPGCKPLGIVGAQYTPLQNREAFAFFDGIVGSGAAVYHTAGALGSSERVWILAKLPGEIRVIGDDITDKYLLLSNSHDGSSAVQVKFTPVRVVCQNTLMMALDHGPTLRVIHDRALHKHLDDTPAMLGIIKGEYGRIGEAFARMATVQINTKGWISYLARVFPNSADPRDDGAPGQAPHKRTELERFFESGCGSDLPGVRGTLWGAYNAVTEYVDHYSRKWKSPAGRLKSVCFGGGYQLKVRAFAVAQEILAGKLN